jgi:hypothetical protein
MATWNSGLTWNSGALWGAASPPPPLLEPNKPKKTKSTMKRQDYYPKRVADHPAWHLNYADRLHDKGAEIGLSAADVAASVNDSRFLGYALGGWKTAVSEFGPAATSELETLKNGTGGTAFTLPVFSPPALPAGLTPVLPGALARIFRFVQAIKAAPGYTEGLGLLLGIVGAEDSAEHDMPEFALGVEQGVGCQCVKIRFKKYGHYAVAIYSQRGTGEWEFLAITANSPYEDKRPLLVPGQPEVRAYKMRHWDAGAESGSWTDVASVTVAP